jgi:hypothetical protein
VEPVADLTLVSYRLRTRREVFMPNNRYVPLQLVLGAALLLTLLPSGCAVGVEPEFEDEPLVHGGSAGKAAAAGGSGAGMPSPPSNGGTTSVSGSGANPFGGSASSGGKGGSGSGSGSGGTNGGAGSAGSGSAGSGSAGSGSAGSSGTSAGGSGGASGGCACTKTLAWTDNMSLSWATGDCVTTGGVTYRYVGTKAQTYAHGDCNPAKQAAWCTDSGNDYKFMACP